MDAANDRALPEQIIAQDVSRIEDAVRCFHCVNPKLWEFFESLGVAR